MTVNGTAEILSGCCFAVTARESTSHNRGLGVDNCAAMGCGIGGVRVVPGRNPAGKPAVRRSDALRRNTIS